MAIDTSHHKRGIAALVDDVLSAEHLDEEFGNREKRSPWVFEDVFLGLALATEAGDPEAPEVAGIAEAPLYDRIDLATEELSIARIRRARGKVVFALSDEQAEALAPYFRGDATAPQ
jgi:hypothetical protein